MGRLTRFPDLREFRARAARLGAATGPIELEPPGAHRLNRSQPVPWMWLGLALAATLSLGWLGWTTLPDSTEPAPYAGRDDLDRVVGEIRAANVRISRIENEIAGLRRSGAALGEADADLRERIDIIEEALGPATGSIGPLADQLPGSEPDGARPVPQGRPAGRPASLLPDVAGLPVPADAPPGPAGLDTASPARSQVAPALTFAVDLGGFGSVVELKQHWAQLLSDNPLLLGGLSPRQVTQLQSDGLRSFRLIAGPVEDVLASRRICEALRLRGADCRQTINSGEPI